MTRPNGIPAGLCLALATCEFGILVQYRVYRRGFLSNALASSDFWGLWPTLPRSLRT